MARAGSHEAGRLYGLEHFASTTTSTPSKTAIMDTGASRSLQDLWAEGRIAGGA